MKGQEISEELYEQFLEAKENKEKSCQAYDVIREKIILLAGDFRRKKLITIFGKNVLKINKSMRHVFYPSRLRRDNPALYKKYAEKKEYCTLMEIKGKR